MNVPHDSSFSDLSTALNVEAVTALLQDALGKDYPHVTVLGGKICDVKHDKDRQYVLLYRFKLRHDSKNRTCRQLFTARVVKNGTPLPDEPLGGQEERFSNLENTLITSPFLRLSGKDIILYPFPHDSAMPWLGEALDARGMKERFNRTEMYGQDLRVRKVRVHLLGYTPQMRASFLYRVLLEDKRTGAEHWEEIIGKTNTFKSPHILYGGIWALWQASQGAIGLPRPIGFMIRPRLTLQEKVRGIRLGSLVDSPSFPDIMRETARSIARFHSLSLPIRTKRKLRDEVRSIERWSNVLMNIRPDLRGRLDSFRQKVLGEIEKNMGIQGPVHADFHHTNVLVDNTEVRLIDLDEMALGDPCLDVGRFLASLRIPSLRSFGTINGLEEERELFLEEYLKTRAEERGTIRLFESASLLVSAASSFRIQRPDWKNEVSLLLDEAEKVFASARNGKGVTIPYNQDKAPQISPTEGVHWALDETYVQALLTPHIQDHYGALLVRCEVQKKKKIHSGHRIRYKVSGWRKNKKWKSLMEGTVSFRNSGNTFFNHLSLLHDVLKDSEARSLFPEPIAFLPQIRTVFTGPTDGRPFLSLLGRPEIMKTTERLARDLSILHNSHIPFRNPVYTVGEELDHIQQRISRLKDRHPRFHSKATALLAELENGERGMLKTTSPIVYDLQPQEIVFMNDTVRITNFTRLRAAHPYLDIGNFLAHLALAGFQNERTEETERVAEHFLSCYRGGAEKGVSLFQGIALLRLACHQLEKRGTETCALLLIERAQKKWSGHD